ncbi:zinc ABC transporter substrate-binding protein [Marinimicrobium sp. ABcell2]|uniref:zinc ABC transporter substrate-binding protein n=1 Tax=Marinimicrobium sp. ABcell2 TaxID=3069751 RepID=UPI0027AEE126|nr:zinc ABC transporter substrate-binding protein [Marinimicrobium sp. ABcell2]MDQ2076229.1 zinc ABC transporter substrate-binding protein [Marinimicrobium sp. ABcell2]
MSRLSFPSFAARSFLLLLIMVASALPARAELQVLVSIKPLKLIAQEVMGGTGEVTSLLEGSASPHDYAMRVSDIRRLRAADLVLWVGPEMETFLVRPLANLPLERILEAQELEGLHWPSGEAAGVHHGDHFHERDPHIWLDPRNGAIIAEALAARLAKLDPKGASQYQANAQRLTEKLYQLDEELQRRLQPVSGRGFAVYHEGYTHFVKRYDLKQIGYVTFGPEQRPGARHMHQLRQRLTDAHCLFVEPYYDTRAAAELARNLDLKVGELDPLGMGSSSYPELIETMAQSFLDCLAP